MGVGGGFMLVPAMIYLLGMPTLTVIGTSLFQVVFVAANVTILQAWQNGTVDIVLTLLLVAGGVAGAQFGAAVGGRLRGGGDARPAGCAGAGGGGGAAVGPAARAGEIPSPSGGHRRDAVAGLACSSCCCCRPPAWRRSGR